MDNFANPLHIYWCLRTLTQLIHFSNIFFHFHPADIYIYIYIHPPNIGVKHLREKEKGEAYGSYSLLDLLLVWGMAPLERENLWSDFSTHMILSCCLQSNKGTIKLPPLSPLPINSKKNSENVLPGILTLVYKNLPWHYTGWLSGWILGQSPYMLEFSPGQVGLRTAGSICTKKNLALCGNITPIQREFCYSYSPSIWE
jgi:hypothetical protein